jgi:hypothetical protein
VVLVEAGKQADVLASLAPAPVADIPSNLRLGGALSDADMAQIRQLLTRYESAVNARDPKQLRAVWPEIPPKKVEQYKALPKGARITLTLTMASPRPV